MNNSMVISIITPKYTMSPKRTRGGGGSEGGGGGVTPNLFSMRSTPGQDSGESLPPSVYSKFP